LVFLSGWLSIHSEPFVSGCRVLVPKQARGELYYDEFSKAYLDWHHKKNQYVYVVLGVGGHNDPMLKGILVRVRF
jgi:hypothetical protein